MDCEDTATRRAKIEELSELGRAFGAPGMVAAGSGGSAADERG